MRFRRREVAAAILAVPLASLGERRSFADAAFAEWLRGLRREALALGIRRETVERAVADLSPLPRVLELDRRQPEARLRFGEYRKRVVSPRRIRDGGELLVRHRALLARVARRYGVPPHILIALWGIESSYGRVTGGFRVIPALATLAWEGRRAAFFHRELLAALRILDAGHIGMGEMTGSWAGAMGQPQFMPTTFLRYAADADGDGRRDIWHSLPDVFASMANYLARLGWRRGYRWGRPVLLSRRLPDRQLGLAHRASLAEWDRRGVRRVDGGRLPSGDLLASLVLPDGRRGEAFLVYDNYRVLLGWNRSHYFALSVGLLADALVRRVS